MNLKLGTHTVIKKSSRENLNTETKLLQFMCDLQMLLQCSLLSILYQYVACQKKKCTSKKIKSSAVSSC